MTKEGGQPGTRGGEDRSPPNLSDRPHKRVFIPHGAEVPIASCRLCVDASIATTVPIPISIPCGLRTSRRTRRRSSRTATATSSTSTRSRLLTTLPRGRGAPFLLMLVLLVPLPHILAAPRKQPHRSSLPFRTRRKTQKLSLKGPQHGHRRAHKNAIALENPDVPGATQPIEVEAIGEE